MKNLLIGPFVPKLSFKFLKEKVEVLSKSKNPIEKFQSTQMLKFFEENPILVEGLDSISEFKEYENLIQQLMGYLFPVALSNNEIKAAVFPLSNVPFYASSRLDKILENSNTHLEEVYEMLFTDHIDGFDLIPYAVILNSHYKFNVDLDRPKNLKIETKNGTVKNYRITFNADFMEIYPNENAIEITQEIIDDLLADATNKEIWKKYFPDNSWTIEGFGVINMVDTTLDESFDAFKTHLIQPNNESFLFLIEDIRKIFGIPDLQLGSYTVEQNQIKPPFDRNFKMLSIDEGETINCEDYACDSVYNQLFLNHKPVILANVARYHERSRGNSLSKTLLKQGFKSAVLLPIVIEGKLAYILELATYKTNQLNAINMVKFETLMPFILSYSKRSITEYENEVSAVIQQECTSIHPSVQWRFEEEATNFIQKRNFGELPTFNQIVFKDVFPLYGQIDIVGSSNARNVAIQKDFQEQLKRAKHLLEVRTKSKKLPFYEHLIFQIDKFLVELVDNFHTNTEQEIGSFFANDIFPLFNHLLISDTNVEDIKAFNAFIDADSKSYYNTRKDYDNTVNLINKKLSSFMDKQQVKAQEIFPHYFEKFKTDGVEHNIYIGQSIAQNKTFHLTDLYNLRLWQLQVLCEMEALYYKAQEELPLKLEVASLILAYDVPLDIRYRMDEKQFDVDGAYNVRYEMIKKRIDKAHIKNTNERLTLPHKLCVVYSSNMIEKEYLNYFEFLQSKNYIGEKIEIVEVEELQGASGIKAIRVDLNHHLEKANNLFTVEDLEAIL